ncbi:phage portal protein [Actinomyces howellii]|uniref:Phage portal protein, SPP1 Gp6-like n=1 Tax=Actinomyces howellii TaxID=52771 RepID=A0A448HGM8_9ACTO|nr:phage portal protein [Actinomyces howellii]VEG28036.1 Phage portal protein, SPP1 Gp6-like [Actinomyces howellii]
MSSVTWLVDPSRDLEVALALGEDLEEFRAVLRRIGAHGRRNRLRRRYYDGEQAARNIQIAIPAEYEYLMPVLGWPAKTCNVLAARTRLEGFAVPGQAQMDAEAAEALDLNRLRSSVRQATVAALCEGCAFVSVTAGDTADGEPPAVVSVYSAHDASGTWDRRRHDLSCALTIDERSEHGAILAMTFWTRSDRVEVFRDAVSASWQAERLPHGFGRVPVVLIPYQADGGRPFGRSRITRPVMRLTDHAARTLLRTEISAEFFSAPQRYLLGADMEAFEDPQTGELMPAWEAVIGHLLVAPRPLDENDHVSESNPVAGQFQQASMEPHNAELRQVAAMFAGETSIPLNFLGIVQDNPSSADAIKAAEADLIAVVEDAQADFSGPWAQIALLAVQAARDTTVPPDDMSGLRPVWRDPSTPTKAAQAQSVMGLVAAGVLPATSEVTYEQLGFDSGTIARLMADAASRRAQQTLSSLAGVAASGSALAQEVASARTDADGTPIA